MVKRLTMWAAVCSTLMALPATAREWGLAEVTRAAEAIVLAQVDDPPTSTEEMPRRTGAGAPYQRYRRHLRVLTPVVGALRGLVLVDEPQWRRQWMAWPQPVELDEYRGTLSREPRPGDVVLAFLARNRQGEWELLVDRALDAGHLRSEVERLRAEAFRARKGGK